MTTLRRLGGVYDADSTVRGELSYWIGARLGRAHCALCDITHGLLRERSDWRACRDGLPIPFDTWHRNDQPDDVRAESNDTAPVVLGQTDDGWVILLDGPALDACGGDPEELVAAIEAAVTAAGISWT